MLRVDGLTAGYGKLPVLHGIGMRAEAGSVTVVVGPNGSGKSTLLKAIIGLLKPSDGSVYLNERNVTGWPSHRIVRSGIGYVPQVNNVFPSLTVVENLEMGAYSYVGESRPRIELLLKAFPDLSASRTKRAGTLSGGQRNLLGVARALVLNPSTLLVDEPTAGLAPTNAQRMWEQLVGVAKTGTAVVVVEQNVDMGLAHADAAYVLIDGRNALSGSSIEVRSADLRAMFLGHHESGGTGSKPTHHMTAR